MLSKFASVTKDGIYKAPANSKVSYGGVSSICAFSYTLTSRCNDLVITLDGVYKGYVSCSLSLVRPFK